MTAREADAFRCGGAAVIAALATGAVAMSRMLDWLNPPGAMLYVLIIGFIIAFAHALFLGLPIFFALRDYWRLRWWSSALGGALIAVIPMMLIFGGGPTQIDLGWQALAGTAGGLAFWCSLRNSPSVGPIGRIS